MATGQWWVIYTINPDSVTAKVVQSATSPKITSKQTLAGPYKTKAEAEKQAGSGYSTLGQAGLGIGSTGAPGSGLAASLLPANATPGSLLGSLGIPGGRSTVMRLAEGALGILLILVGIAKLAEGSPIATAIKKVPII